MAKKNQEKVVIVDKELTPTVIGRLDTKQKSPVILIFIFLIFLGVALFLPDITNYVENYMNGNKQHSNKPNVNTPVVDNENSEKEPEIKYYDYTSDLKITHESFTISNIEVIDNLIKFDITNDTNNVLDLSKSKYYLEVYSEDTTLIQRIKISYGEIAASATNSYSYDLDDGVSNSLSKLLVITKTEADYPEAIIETDEAGNGSLVCTKGYETITYSFGNGYLININDVVDYPNTQDMDYSNTLQDYQILATTYNNIAGISSTIVPLETGFTFTAVIDLRTADIKNLENNNYYNYRTEAKIVKFETESNGYSCN